MKRNLLVLLAVLTVSLLCVSCKDDGPKIPAYLHLDKINVTHPTDGTTMIYGDAFLTSEIDACQIECYFDGIDTSAILGTFPLPCTVPVLCNERKIRKIVVYPFVRQDGVVATHIPYPFYLSYTDTNLVVAPDSVTNIGTQDADGLWTINTPYRSTSVMRLLKSEWFEPVQLNVAFDSTVERVNDAQTACSGYGYGRVHISADEQSKMFFIQDLLTEKDPTSYLYLEMDYWTDTPFDIGMQSQVSATSSTSVAGCVTLHPNKHWQKIYINLGRTWRYFNYNKDFRIVFTVFNLDQTDGDVRIDNVKVLSL